MQAENHPPLRDLTIASRGSQLALWQAEHVKAELAKQRVTASIKIIKTTGDRVQDRFLHEIGGKGVFVREIEEALLEGSAQLAVHSLKDLPALTPAPFHLAAVLPRHASGDVMIFHPELASSLGLADGCMLTDADLASFGPISIGTGSLRRRALLEAAAPLIKVTPIRGNVDTRLAKLRAGAWQAIVLAEASLERLGLAKDLVKAILEPKWFTPSPSQGALVIETIDQHAMAPWLTRTLGCPRTSFAVAVERGVLAGLGGDCTLPIGVHAAFSESHAQTARLHCRAVLLDGKSRSVRSELHWEWQSTSKAEEFARALVGELVRAGANDVLKSLGLPPVEPSRGA